jgi:hypothetical protein
VAEEYVKRREEHDHKALECTRSTLDALACEGGKAVAHTGGMA